MAPAPSNSTVPVTDHGIQGLVCTPAKWSSVLTFILVNYFAHCLTIKFYPAETPREIVSAVLGALLFPSLGLSRAIDAIRRRPRLLKINKVERALVAGALCMVVRNKEWEPREGDVLKNLRTRSDLEDRNLDPGELTRSINSKNLVYDLYSPPWMKESTRGGGPVKGIKTRDCKVHGAYRLPPGYDLAYVPPDAVLSFPEDIPEMKHLRTSIDIATSNSLVKTGLAILQTGYGAYSLYIAQGDQITLYGYAAFGLSVVPYIIMSVLNLISQIAADDYPKLYLVHTAEMEEATRRGGVFLGAVARLNGWNGGKDMVAKQQELTGFITSNDGPWRVTEAIPANTGENPHPQPCCTLEAAQSGSHKFQMNLHRNADRSFVWSKSPETSARMVCVPIASKFQRQGQPNDHPLKLTEWSPYLLQMERRAHGAGFVCHTFFYPLALSLLSLAFYGGFSRFDKGTKSTSIERGFMISWLIAGMTFGFLFPLLIKRWNSTGNAVLDIRYFGFDINDFFDFIVGLGLFVFCVPAVGGLVMVGKMIMDFGDCTRT